MGVTLIASIVLATVAVGAEDPAVGSADEPAVRFVALVERMAAHARDIRDYTCVFTKQERVGDEMQPMETAFVKHRGPGVCLYMKWIENPHRGRESIYCEGRYDDKIQAHEGSGISSWINVSLDPNGRLAMRGNRRAITDAGIFNTIRFIASGFSASAGAPAMERFRSFDDREVHGQPSVCAVTIPGDDAASGERLSQAELCIHETLLVPTLVKIWDRAGDLVGTYTYRDYRLNVGLTDHDFDVDNAEYDFQ